MMIRTTCISLLTTLLLTGQLLAMPTAEELAEVRPLVAELIKPDMDAMRAGKKSKTDAAKASLSLASQAETPAAKLLLTRNAFQLYMKGGDYDAADAALDAMLKAVPDYPADELQELLEKALYPVPSKKAPQIRARVVALKQKAAAATQLKKVLALLERTPDDPALNLRLGTVYALQNDWNRAVPAFAKGSDAALAKAAKAELDLEISPAKAADLYWSVELPKKDAQLQSSLRAHAADLYKLSLPDLTGLTKVQAARRIKEVAEPAVSMSQSTSAADSHGASSTESAKFTGVKLVGPSVKLSNGILSGFAGNSYALIEPEFSPATAPTEAVVEFTTGDRIAATFGVMGGVGSADGFTPFYVAGMQAVGYLSNSGKAWDVASAFPLGVPIQAKETYRMKCIWDGKTYAWFIWRGRWLPVKELPSSKAVCNGLKLQLGTNRGQNSPLLGTIDLNKCYIKVGGKLWWEGVKGAYKNANK